MGGRMKTKRYPAVAGALVVALLATTWATPAQADDTPSDGPPGTESVFASAGLEAPTTYNGFGSWLIEGSFRLLTPIPESRGMLALDDESGRLARVDLETSEVTLGDEFNADAVAIHVAAGGNWVYVQWVLAGIPRFDRYSRDDLKLESSFDIDERIFGHMVDGVEERADLSGVRVVPGADETVLMTTTFEVFAVRDGVVLPSLVNHAVRRAEIRVRDATTAYMVTGSDAFVVTYGPSGVTAVVRVGDGGLGYFNGNLRAFPIHLRDDDLVIGDAVYSLPEFIERPSTEADQATDDPVLPLRYLGGIGYRLVFDEAGQLISRASYTCAAPQNKAVLTGGGLLVRADWNGLQVWDLVDRCGSYGEFTPVPPARVFDTRSGQGNGGVIERLGPQSTRRIKIHGLAGVPETGVESVVLNVTVVGQAGAANYVTAWPAGFERPLVASVNLSPGETLGNMVTVSTAAGGYVDVYSNAGTADLVIDVMGYFASALAPNGSRFEKLPTTRLLDTRTAGGRLGPEQWVHISPSTPLLARTVGAGCCWARSDVTAVVLNVTAIQSSDDGHLRIFPAGSTLPDASAMNFLPGKDINRLVTVKVGDDADIEIWNAIGSVDLAVDLVGVYIDRFAEQQNGRFIGLVPGREIDTRLSSPFPGDGALLGGHFLISGGYRSEVDLVANLTAVDAAGGGYLSAGPWGPQITGESGYDLPNTSSLNFDIGSTIGNQAIIRPDREGDIAVYASAGSHVVLDVFGFYTAPE